MVSFKPENPGDECIRSRQNWLESLPLLSKIITGIKKNKFIPIIIRRRKG